MNEPWTVEAVARRFADAADTARRLPPVRVQGYRSSWPQCAREAWEALARDDDRPVSLPPSPQAVERMLQAMQWVQWLEVEQRHLVWLRAQRYGWSDIGKRVGLGRLTAWRRWMDALAVVAGRLNEAIAAVGSRSGK